MRQVGSAEQQVCYEGKEIYCRGEKRPASQERLSYIDLPKGFGAQYFVRPLEKLASSGCVACYGTEH